MPERPTYPVHPVNPVIIALPAVRVSILA